MPTPCDPASLVQADHFARALGIFFVETRVPAIALTHDGRFVAANRATIDQYGYSLGELLTMRIYDLVAPDYPRSRIEADLGAAASATDLLLERRPHRRKDGTILWVVPTAGAVVVEGEPYVVSVLQDVTTLLEAESKVRELEVRAQADRERAELLWEAASERLTAGAALFDEELRVVRCNSTLSALTRMTVTDILGRRCRDLFPYCRRTDPCPHKIALREQRRVVSEIHGSICDRPLRIEVIPAPTSQPHFALVHIAHDLTEERAARSRLITADRLATIGRLAAGVAHEVNNPAAFVTVNLGVLRDRFASGTAHTSDAITILDESLNGMDRIRDIMRDLKGLSRERSKDRVDLSALVASALRMATHETRGRALVDKQLEPGLYANVRGARVAQVVLNLMVNAAQAIPAGNPAKNRIFVRTWREGERAKIEVSDTGPGVPAELAERIFEPFFTTRETTGGTGLGLWLAREIVIEEGGTIEASNVADGGARFVVELAALAASSDTQVARLA